MSTNFETGLFWPFFLVYLCKIESLKLNKVKCGYFSAAKLKLQLELYEIYLEMR